MPNAHILAPFAKKSSTKPGHPMPSQVLVHHWSAGHWWKIPFLLIFFGTIYNFRLLVRSGTLDFRQNSIVWTQIYHRILPKKQSIAWTRNRPETKSRPQNARHHFRSPERMLRNHSQPGKLTWWPYPGQNFYFQTIPKYIISLANYQTVEWS